MKVATVAEMKAHLSAYLRASEENPVVVTRNGKPVAVLLGVEDEDELERLVLSHSKRFRTILELADKQIRDGQGLSHEAFWSEVEGTTDRLAEATPESEATARGPD
jgi:prevent-host-death family protein